MNPFVALACLCLVVAGATAPNASRQTMSPESAARWSEDLDFVSKQLAAVHPNPFREIAAKEWGAEIDAMKSAAPGLTQSQMTIRLAALLARVGDGHTRLSLPLSPGIEFFQGHQTTAPPTDPALLVHDYPIRVRVLADGVFVDRIAADHASAIGAKLEAIDGMPMADVIKRVSTVIERDNEWQIRDLLPSRLVIPEILQAVGVVSDLRQVDVTLRSGDQAPFTLRLATSKDAGRERLVGPASVERNPPLYLRHPDAPFWFEYLEASNTVYFQYNNVADGPTETLAHFSERLFEFVDKKRADRLVIDLRFNHGGNAGLNLPLLHALIRSNTLQGPGRVFVIIGPGTFSAAMNFVVDLERHTSAIFVGEPTGSRPNHYGDARKIVLPKTGLTARIATLYWQLSDPRDGRVAALPQLPVSVAATQYFAAEDPILDAILAPALARRSALTGTWQGTFGPWFDRRRVELQFSRPNSAADSGAMRRRTSSGTLEAGVRVTGLVDRGGRVSFSVGTDNASTFDLRAEGDRLAGTVRQGNTVTPAIFTRIAG